MKTCIFILMTFATINSFGQKADTTYFPIDKQCDECLNTASTTTDMMLCFGQSREAWGLEVSKYYGLLMAKLKPEQKVKLAAAQEAWMSYKEIEFELCNYIYYDEEQGREKKIDAISRHALLFKQRALDLMVYYDLYLQK